MNESEKLESLGRISHLTREIARALAMRNVPNIEVLREQCKNGTVKPVPGIAQLKELAEEVENMIPELIDLEADYEVINDINKQVEKCWVSSMPGRDLPLSLSEINMILISFYSTQMKLA